MCTDFLISVPESSVGVAARSTDLAATVFIYYFCYYCYYHHLLLLLMSFLWQLNFHAEGTTYQGIGRQWTVTNRYIAVNANKNGATYACDGMNVAVCSSSLHFCSLLFLLAFIVIMIMKGLSVSALWFDGFASFPIALSPPNAGSVNVIDFVDFLLANYSSVQVFIFHLFQPNY